MGTERTSLLIGAAWGIDEISSAASCVMYEQSGVNDPFPACQWLGALGQVSSPFAMNLEIMSAGQQSPKDSL